MRCEVWCTLGIVANGFAGFMVGMWVMYRGVVKVLKKRGVIK